MTYTLIAHTELTSGQAAITFSSIPQTFTDLLVVYSMRSSGLSQGRQVGCKFNNLTTNFSTRALYANSSGSSDSYNLTDPLVGMYPGSADTANSFSSQSFYIANYRTSNSKSFSVDSVYGNNGPILLAIIAGLWSNSSAISEISLYNSDGSNVWVTGSSATLYGITAGSSGGVVVS